MEKPLSLEHRTVLLVDDVDVNRATTECLLSNLGYSVDSVCSAEDALAIFNPRTHDAVITDNSMACMTGVEMAHIIKLRSPATPILMITGSPPADRSCLDFVGQRPLQATVLRQVLEGLLPRRSSATRPPPQ